MSTGGPVNPATVGAMQQPAGHGGSAIGGEKRILGGLIGESTGWAPQGSGGLFAKQIMAGGLFNLTSGSKAPPGILSQMGLTPTKVMASLCEIAKQDPVIQAGLQSVSQQMTGGVESVSMAQSGQLSSAGAPMAASRGGDMEIG